MESPLLETKPEREYEENGLKNFLFCGGGGKYESSTFRSRKKHLLF